MGIRVRCSNGHSLNVKDSYAGKKGRCPHCKVLVDVPEKAPVSDDEIMKVLMAGGLPKHMHANAHGSDDGGSIHDEPHKADKSDSLSLLGLSAVKHSRPCHGCGNKDPHWYATCSNCGAAYPGHDSV